MSPVSGYLPAPAEDAVSEAIPDEAGQSEGNASASRELFVKHQPSPRRTLRLRFHCNCCGADNVNSVNPVAWRRGTVLMECGSCGVQHKMVDHLQLFHDLGGALFPSATSEQLARLRAGMPPHLLPDLAGLEDGV